jgi:hypothetical protein
MRRNTSRSPDGRGAFDFAFGFDFDLAMTRDFYRNLALLLAGALPASKAGIADSPENRPF